MLTCNFPWAVPAGMTQLGSGNTRPAAPLITLTMLTLSSIDLLSTTSTDTCTGRALSPLYPVFDNNY